MNYHSPATEAKRVVVLYSLMVAALMGFAHQRNSPPYWEACQAAKLVQP